MDLLLLQTENHLSRAKNSLSEKFAHSSVQISFFAAAPVFATSFLGCFLKRGEKWDGEERERASAKERKKEKKGGWQSGGLQLPFMSGFFYTEKNVIEDQNRKILPILRLNLKQTSKSF